MCKPGKPISNFGNPSPVQATSQKYQEGSCFGSCKSFSHQGKDADRENCLKVVTTLLKVNDLVSVLSATGHSATSNRTASIDCSA